MALAGGQQQFEQTLAPVQSAPAAALPPAVLPHLAQAPLPSALPPPAIAVAHPRPPSASLGHDGSIVPYHSNLVAHANPQQLLVAHPSHQLLQHPQQGNVQILVLEWTPGGQPVVSGGGMAPAPVVGGAGVVDEAKPVVRRCMQPGCRHPAPSSGACVSTTVDDRCNCCVRHHHTNKHTLAAWFEGPATTTTSS
eukprot:1192390-Prorocentrum_minimum.AAC.2